MKSIRVFLTTTLIGGMVVILPIAILFFVLNWIFNILIGIIDPLTSIIPYSQNMHEFLVNVIAVFIIILFSFLVGLFVKTRIGKTLFGLIEEYLFHQIPFYKTIRETIQQLIGNKKMPFSKIVLATPFGNETKMTGFITDEHADGSFTVFIPTGPNPTSGSIFHLQPHQLEILDVPVEMGMRTILSCGTGSTQLFAKRK